MPDLVRAGGGVVWRHGNGGEVEVLLVHRPRYDDWSLPKGKCDRGETERDAAEREVWEETGLRCRLGDELPETRYVDHKGRPKLVRYWEMTVIEGTFAANDEVDEIRWLTVAEASDALSYVHDRPVLEALDPS